MDASTDLRGRLAPGRKLRDTSRPGIATALTGATDPGAPYDRHARLYDRLVGTRWYNRIAWGTTPAVYTAFAAEAVAAGTGPLLDVGCGTACFSAPAYRGAGRQLVLVDRSVGMLSVAQQRLGPAPVTMIQADLFDLPFEPGQFETVVCHAMLHVLDEPWQALAALRDQLAPGGRLFASMLVTDRRGISRPFMPLLRRQGELGPLHTAGEFAAAGRDVFRGATVSVQRIGSMAYLRVGCALQTAPDIRD